MLDYTGSFAPYQRKLDDNGIDFDVTILAGVTKNEIESYVNNLIKGRYCDNN